MRKYKAKNYHCLYIPNFNNDIDLQDLPDAWECPICGTDKKNFIPIGKKGDKDLSIDGQDKHVPVVTQEGNNVRVKVGKVAHPMGEDHLITKIGLYKAERLVEEKELNSTDKSEVLFENINYNDSYTVIATCNLHGMWEAQ